MTPTDFEKIEGALEFIGELEAIELKRAEVCHRAALFLKKQGWENSLGDIPADCIRGSMERFVARHMAILSIEQGGRK